MDLTRFLKKIKIYKMWKLIMIYLIPFFPENKKFLFGKFFLLYIEANKLNS